MRRVLVLGLVLATLAMPDVGLGWSWPVDGEVLRGFSMGPDPYAAGQHRGIDVSAVEGETVVAPADGEVTFAGTVPSRGKSISILTPSGFSITLSHLGELAVVRGRTVTEGEVVGRAGRSGVGDHPEPYVQLGVRDASDPNGYRDPLAFLPARTESPLSASVPDPVPAPVVDAIEMATPAEVPPGTSEATSTQSLPTQHVGSSVVVGAAPSEPDAVGGQIAAPGPGAGEATRTADQPVAADGELTALTIPSSPASDDLAWNRTGSSAWSAGGARDGVSVASDRVALQASARTSSAAPAEVVGSSASSTALGSRRSMEVDDRGVDASLGATRRNGSQRPVVDAIAKTTADVRARSSSPEELARRTQVVPRDDRLSDALRVRDPGRLGATARPALSRDRGLVAPSIALAFLIALLTTASVVVRRARSIEAERFALTRHGCHAAGGG